VAAKPATFGPHKPPADKTLTLNPKFDAGNANFLLPMYAMRMVQLERSKSCTSTRRFLKATAAASSVSVSGAAVASDAPAGVDTPAVQVQKHGIRLLRGHNHTGIVGLWLDSKP